MLAIVLKGSTMILQSPQAACIKLDMGVSVGVIKKSTGAKDVRVRGRGEEPYISHEA